jgi:hypothetical protein
MVASEPFCLCKLQECDVETEDPGNDVDVGQRVAEAVVRNSGDVHLYDVETTGALHVLVAAVPCAAKMKTPSCSEEVSKERFTC